jgi:hypothetical protein
MVNDSEQAEKYWHIDLNWFNDNARSFSVVARGVCAVNAVRN